MDPDEARRRLGAARVATLATVRPDGRPHAVPCSFALHGDVAYSAVDDLKPKSTLALRRLDNVRAHPSACLLADHYDEDWASLWWVRADGAARVLDDDGERQVALGLLADKYEPYRRQPPPGPVIALDVTAWSWWAAG